MNPFIQYAESHAGEILATLREIVERESFTSDKAGVDRLGGWIKDWLEGVGASVEVLPNQSLGDNLLAHYGDGDDQVLILCHIDTVWPPGTIDELPFRVEDGRAFGPGILDMKAGVAITLHAMTMLRALQVSTPHRVAMIFNTDEEIQSTNSRSLIERESLNSKFVLCLEPGYGTTGALKTARKGVGSYTVRITGRAAHAGNDPENGISAAEEVAHQILRLKDLNNPKTGTTVTTGMVRAGVVRNQVAPSAEALVDLRVVTPEEQDRVDALIRGLTPVLAGAKVEVTGGVERPPMPRSEGIGRIYESASNLAIELGMELQEESVGGGSDAQFPAALGVPVLDGLGPVHTNASKMRANSMKPKKRASSLSKREKIRRKPFNRLNKRSTSLRLLYTSLSYSHGATRVESGGTTGMNLSSKASWRVSFPSYARSITTCRFSCCGLPGGQTGRRRLSSLRPSGAS